MTTEPSATMPSSATASVRLMLNRPWPTDRAARLPARTLAYIGDSVFELAMRLHHLETGVDESGRLHSSVVGIVCADSQAKLFEAVFPTLSEDEQILLRTWRNAKMPHRTSGASRGAYARATAFEAWVGFLFLTGQQERCAALVQQALPAPHPTPTRDQTP